MATDSLELENNQSEITSEESTSPNRKFRSNNSSPNIRGVNRKNKNGGGNSGNSSNSGGSVVQMSGGSGSGNMKGDTGKLSGGGGSGGMSGGGITQPTDGNTDNVSSIDIIKINYLRIEYSAQLTLEFGVDSVEDLTDSQILDYINGAGKFSTIFGIFDVDVYRDCNKDLAGMSDADLTVHFLNHGMMEENRTFSAVVDINYYKEVNADLTGKSNKEALQHLVEHGLEENREFSAFVSLDFYKQTNKDLSGKSTKEALQHLVEYGFDENRQFSAFCDLNYYRQENEDLYGMSAKQALQHLIQYGVEEGRSFSAVFDVKFYLTAHSDLAGMSYKEAVMHFFQYGINEERSFSSLIDVNGYKATNAEVLIKFFGVASLEEISYAQVVQFMAGAGLQAGISPSDQVDIGYFISEPPAEGLAGGEGNDMAGGGTGNDMAGGEGNDMVDGGAGNDSVNGGQGNDSVNGGEATDTMNGGQGNDTMNGGEGSDSVVGGGGLPPVFVPPSNNPGGTPTPPGGTPTPPGGTPTPPGGEPGPGGNPVFSIDFVIKNNLELLQAQFPTIDFSATLTEEQIAQVQAFVDEQKLNPAPFVESATLAIKLENAEVIIKLLEAGYTNADIQAFTQEQAANALIEVGESPTTLFSFEFVLAKNPELKTEFTQLDGTVDYKALFDYCTVGEGATMGLELSVFFDVQAAKVMNLRALSDYATEEFGITTAEVQDSATFTNEEVLQYAVNETASVVNVEYGLYKYTLTIAKFFKEELALDDTQIETLSPEELVVQIKAAITAQTIDVKDIEACMLQLASDKTFGLSEIDFKGMIQDADLKVKLKMHFFGSETVDDAELETISETKIKEFIGKEAFKLKLDIKEYVDTEFYTEKFKVQIKNAFSLTDDAGIATLDANKIARFFLGDGGEYIDTKFYRMKYGAEQTADGKLVKDLNDFELKLHVHGEGWAPGVKKLSAFDVKGYAAVAANQAALLEAYGATTIEEVSQGQIVAFMKGEGLKKGLKLDTFLDQEIVTEIKTTEQAAIANFFKIDVTEVASLSANLVFEYKYGGLGEYADSSYLRYMAQKESLTTEAGEVVATLSEAKLLEYVYSEKSQEVGFTVSSLSAFDYEAFIAVQANADALKVEYGVKDVAELDVKQIREFMLNGATELGLSLEGSVDTGYIRETFAAAIASTLEGVTAEQVATDTLAVTDLEILNWVSTEQSSIDTEFVSYQLEKWIAAGTLTVAEVAAFIPNADPATFTIESLTEKQLIDLSFNADFKISLTTKGVLAEGEEVKLSGIDTEGFVAQYSTQLSAFYVDVLAGADVSTLSQQQIIDYMGEAMAQEGIDVSTFVTDISYIREEHAAEIAQHFGVAIEVVQDATQFSDKLVLDWELGGSLSKYIDKEYLETAKGITGDAEWKVLNLAYQQGLKAADVSEFDVAGYSKKFLQQLADELEVPYGQLKKLDKWEIDQITEFGLSDEGLALPSTDGSTVSAFIKADYLRQNKAEDIASNYNAENATLDDAETQEFLTTEAQQQGLETSAIIDKEWFSTTYATELEAKKQTIDADASGLVEDDELTNYMKTAGLEEGKNPSKAVNLEEYRQTYSQDLLTQYSATSIEEVSYQETLEYSLTIGLEKGYKTSSLLQDFEAYKTANSGSLVKEFNVTSVTEITTSMTYEFMIGQGQEMGINPYVA